jgi:hypothetical protein
MMLFAVLDVLFYPVFPFPNLHTVLYLDLFPVDLYTFIFCCSFSIMTLAIKALDYIESTLFTPRVSLPQYQEGQDRLEYLFLAYDYFVLKHGHF